LIDRSQQNQGMTPVPNPADRVEFPEFFPYFSLSDPKANKETIARRHPRFCKLGQWDAALRRINR